MGEIRSALHAGLRSPVQRVIAFEILVRCDKRRRTHGANAHGAAFLTP